MAMPPGQHMMQPQGPPPEDQQPGPEGMKLKISRSVGTILKVPKCHQGTGMEKIDAKLDSTLTGKMDNEEGAVVIWILTRIKPDFKIADLRCEYYEELWGKYQHAAERIKDRICFVSYPQPCRDCFFIFGFLLADAVIRFLKLVLYTVGLATARAMVPDQGPTTVF